MTDLAIDRTDGLDRLPALVHSRKWAAAIKLSLAMTAGGLILLAFVWRWAFPEQPDIASLVAGLAAALVAMPVLVSAWHSLRAPSLHGVTDQLVAMALVAAWATGDLLTAAILPILMTVGHVLEERSLTGSQEAIRALGRLGRDAAHRIRADGSVEDVAASTLKIGDRVAIRPGERIPVDGKVEQGSSSLDTSLITGESAPIDIRAGAEIFAGAIALDGALTISVSRVGAESTLGKIVELLQAAARSKPRISRLLERYAGPYVAVVLLVAAGTWLLTNDSQAMLAVLVAACPCALVLAVPATAVAAVAVAGRHGILIKGTAFLEELADVTSVILDKTGTVTEGELLLQDIIAAPGMTRSKALQIAGSLGGESSHPISRALARSVSSPIPVSDVKEVAGLGLTGQIEAGTAVLGRAEFFRELQIQTLPLPRHDGPIVGLAIGGCFAAWFLLADQPRAEAAAAIADLERLGCHRILMVTGDRPAVANRIARAVGIAAANVSAGVLPAGKLDLVLRETAAGYRPLVVGDGINDSLALKAGAVGVAMGVHGTDVALAAADLVLMTTDLRRLGTAIRLGRRCRQVIQLNVAIGLGWTTAIIGIASFGALGPSGAFVAAILHNLGTLLVMANAGSLFRFNEIPAQSCVRAIDAADRISPDDPEPGRDDRAWTA